VVPERVHDFLRIRGMEETEGEGEREREGGNREEMRCS
jgi:hypothetical protein